MKKAFPVILTFGLFFMSSILISCNQHKTDEHAIIVLDSPDIMKPWKSNMYRWDAVFMETGGKSGFKVKATDFYIQGPTGKRWSNGWNETHKVKAGGSKNVDYYIDKSDKWAGGKFHCVWIGEDDSEKSNRSGSKDT